MTGDAYIPSTGRISSSEASSPPTHSVSRPAAMSCGPPESAASSTLIPRPAPAVASVCAVAGSEVVCWTSVAPGFMAAMAPSGPRHTDRTCSSVSTTTNTASASRTVAVTEPAQVSPSASADAAASGQRTRTVTS